MSQLRFGERHEPLLIERFLSCHVVGHFLTNDRVEPTWLLTSIEPPKQKTRRGGFCVLGWLMGFEPTTTGITIQDSTAELQPPLTLLRTEQSISS